MNGTQRTGDPQLNPQSAGFTLLELMLVVAIMIIAVAFAYPAIREARHREAMTQAMKDITDLCRRARAEAILTGQPMELRIFPHDMRFEVGQAPVDVPPPSPSASPAPGATDDGSAPAPATYRKPPSPFISSAQLSDQVRIEMFFVNFVDCQDYDMARVRFYPNGTCDDMTIIIQQDMDERKISLEAVTSLVKIDTDARNFNNDD